MSGGLAVVALRDWLDAAKTAGTVAVIRAPEPISAGRKTGPSGEVRRQMVPPPWLSDLRSCGGPADKPHRR